MTDRAMKSAADWDARYAAATAGLFGEAPNAWLAMALARPGLAAASALCLADGDGRNGTWLARQGLAVTAVDISAEGTRRALARDRAAGVTVAREVADLGSWEPGDRRWDLAAVIYLQGPEAVRRRAAHSAAAALAPGGWLLLECFAKAQAGLAMGPDTPDRLWSAAEIRAWAPDLTLVELLEGEVLLDEGPRHSGTARVLRLLARGA